jgi:hypothetical protein
MSDFEKYPEPKIIYDDLGVKHQNEIPLESIYELYPCECGIKHEVEDDTWWHATVPLFERHKVVRACKKCMNVLCRERKD